MFSILQKSPETVNAEDLETLQNEIERCLVDIVGQKWSLERELVALENPSPDLTSPSPISSSANSAANQAQSSTNLHDTKFKDSLRSNQVDNTENSTDEFKSLFGSNSGAPDSASGSHTTEDSISSESSLVSSLTSSTIITTVPDSGSQPPTNSSSGIKRSHKSTNERPSKRFRQNSSNPFSPAPFTKRPHSKHRFKVVPSKFRNASEESRPHKKQLQRNDAPDKLWPFVEQFCATPMEEQLKELEEMINSMDNDKDYFKIPALGKKDSSSKESPNKSDTPNSKSQKKMKSRGADEEAGLGALTQRLVSSFIEESNDSTDLAKSTTGTQPTRKKNSKNSKGTKTLDINSAKNLEKRIRQELEEYNILDKQDDIPYTSEDDEILRELVTSQHELLSIQRQNKDSMQRLLKKARKHLELDVEREKLREANADVISAYHRLIQAKQRKRNPTKREKDAAWKALKVQEAIFKRCDDLYLSNLNRGS